MELFCPKYGKDPLKMTTSFSTLGETSNFYSIFPLD